MKLPIQGIIKKTIFKQFCGGETLEEASNTALQLKKYGIDVIMDYGVEGKSDEAEFEKNVHTFIRTIEFSSDKAHIPFISLKVTGFADFQLLEKVHAESPLSVEEQEAFARVKNRVKIICETAAKNGKMILIDAEESWIQQPVDDLVDEMMALFNRERVVVFNTFQLYRHDRLAFLKSSFEKAQKGAYLLGAKLVRGAYMEKERARALEMNYPSPIQENKAASDRDFDAALSFCIEHLPSLEVFIGTHNESSCLLAVALMQQKNMEKNQPGIYFSQLYGMSDNISFNLSKEGYHVSKYLPYGPVADVIPYLMRRAQENTSVAGQTGRELGLIQKELKRRAESK
jgi:proline dehydrogenase